MLGPRPRRGPLQKAGAMRNSPRLPAVALVAAVALAGIVWLTHGNGPLTELELGGIAWSIGLAIFGLQGLLSVLVEGQELHPGRVRPRLTGPLSVGIVVLALALVGTAVALAWGLTGNWGPEALGWVAGAGCLILAVMLVLYKEGFVGDEASFDEREDGVPW
jgi:peptidoglycan/LPS O-acetylase OafA/YrhL